MAKELKYCCLEKNDIIIQIVRENECLKKLLNQDENKRYLKF